MDITTQRRHLLHTLNRLITDDSSIELDDLRSRAHQVAPILTPALIAADIESVIDDIIELRKVELRLGIGVVDQAEFTEWIEERKPTVELTRWNAYRELLFERNWAPNVIANLDAQTDRLVELMGDPTVDGEWGRRGLAIGEVQSGKTATYVGVLNKAIDYGYNLIVIIGGHTEDLRRQTQQRVDSDLLGFDSAFTEDHIDATQAKRLVGVGLIDGTTHTNVLTTTNSDFNSAAKRTSRVAIGGAVPTVFVVKKNAAVLRNLANYLKQQHASGRLSVPLVVIDDEADWASINTRGEDDVAAVNGAIRELLNSATRSSYMAITATPFANVLIDDANEDDLFPRHYIQALESPSNYSGISRYFGDGESPGEHAHALIDDVADCVAMLPYSHKRTHLVTELPESLHDAIATFLVGVGVRRLRGDGSSPAAMMVNVSRFNDIQTRIHGLTQAAVLDLLDAAAAEFAMPSGGDMSPATHRLMRMYEREYSHVEFTWQQIRAELIDVLRDVRIELVNGRTTNERARRRSEMSAAAREEEDRLPTIYVGGNVLARGLTLNGLQVSYFVRRAGAADTLLQMGRWFGYRPRYEDLVRIWIDSDVVDLFGYVAEISDDLRRSMREMNAMKLTPEHFGIKIRRHPETFMVTAASKQRAGEFYDGKVLVHGHKFESVALPPEWDARARNRAALRALVTEAEEVTHYETTASEHSGHMIWRGVPRGAVERFFLAFRGHDSDPYFGLGNPTATVPQIAQYLGEAVNGAAWDVVLVNGSGGSHAITANIKQAASARNQLDLLDGRLYFANRRVATGSDIRNVIPRSALRELQESLNDEEKLTETTIVRRGLQRPAILLYSVSSKELPDSIETPIAAVVLAFPGLSPQEEAQALRERAGARFVVNKVFARAHLGVPDEEEMEEGE